MKNLKTIGISILFTAVTISCQKDNPIPTPIPPPVATTPTCGCESLSTGVVTNLTGLLKKDSDNKLFIQIGTPPGITVFYYICNESLLTFNVPPAGINVTFSGSDAKNCKDNDSNPPNYLYKNIKLTQIQP